MRIPIKFNLDGFPVMLRNRLHGKHDPRRLLDALSQHVHFEQSITGVNIDGTWKRTNKNRQPQTDRMLAEAIEGEATALPVEVGASVGMTLVELVRRLGGCFGKCYVTDLYFFMRYAEWGQKVHFCHPIEPRSIVHASNTFITHEDTAATIFPLCLLAQNPRLVVQEHDILKPRQGEKVDAIKVANILNRSCLSDPQLKQALTSRSDALREDGIIVIADNMRPPKKPSNASKKSRCFARGKTSNCTLSKSSTVEPKSGI